MFTTTITVETTRTEGRNSQFTSLEGQKVTVVDTRRHLFVRSNVMKTCEGLLIDSEF